MNFGWSNTFVDREALADEAVGIASKVYEAFQADGIVVFQDAVRSFVMSEWHVEQEIEERRPHNFVIELNIRVIKDLEYQKLPEVFARISSSFLGSL